MPPQHSYSKLPGVHTKEWVGGVGQLQRALEGALLHASASIAAEQLIQVATHIHAPRSRS